MKKIFTLIITVLCAAALFAQAPERFSYQAVVRNASNALMVNAQVGVRVNIMQGSATGSAVYSETHIVTTNTNGLMTLNIGSGSVLHGNLEGINWADGPYYLKTDIDPNGGNDYTITTTQQLLSVPYALYAKDAGNVPTIPTNISAFTNDAGYLTSQDMPEIPTVPTNVSAFTNDAGYLTNYIETDPQYNAWNKDYNDLINKPTIPVVPTNVSAFTNDAGYITSANIPTVPTNLSAFNNDVGYITSANIPTVPANLSAFNNDVGYVTATQIPSQVNADWNATTGAALILNKPNIFSGNYNDLTNKPTIPTIPANVSAFNNDAGYITVSNIPSNVSVFNNDAHYITEAELNALLSSMNNTIDSLRDRIEELETNPPAPQTSAPTVTTMAVSSITTTSAICGGNVTSDGSSTVTARGVCWGTSHNPTVSGNHTSDGSGIGSFTSSISGLSSNTTYYVRAYATNGMGTSYGSEVSFTTSTPFVCGTGKVTDYDGNVYNTVQIGNQCWLKENLRSTHYANGTEISSGLGNSYSTTEAYYYPSDGDFYNGYFYNWKAVMGNASSSAANPSGVQGICPNGWHVPSDAEWNQLTNYVSGQSEYLCSNTTEYIAKALSSTTGWLTNSSACAVGNNLNINNATGFNALPAGYASYAGPGYSGVYASFSSSTEASGDDVWLRRWGSGEAVVNRLRLYKNYAFSVRCLHGAGSFLTTPTVTTNTTVNNVTSTTATCGGNVTSDGDATVTARGMCWSTSQIPTVSDSHTTNGSGTGSFTSNISGLSANTTYYVRAYATNSVGTAYGEQISFTTTSNPVVTTNTVSDVSTTSATCGGNVTSDGNATVTARGVCWNTSQNPTVSGSHTTNGNGTGSFTSNITGLSTNTMYYVRAYATNSVGTAYGEQRSFTTIGVPSVTTNSVSNITATTASCGGNVTSTGGTSVTARGVCWSTSQNPTVSGNHTTDGSGSGSFTSSITGLTANTTYYVRAYATNSEGTVYGEQKSFTTLTTPTVTSNTVSNITATTATCGGNVTSTGGTSVTARGVCWSTSQNPTVSGSHTADGSGSGSYTSSITGLTANTTYYVRAYATNSAGTAYGEQRTFTTTMATLPTVVSNGPIEWGASYAICSGDVTSDGGSTVTARGFCWGTSWNPTVNNSHTSDGGGTGSYTSNITGLSANTEYYVRAYATNSVGTAYGQQYSFTTNNVPAVTTSAVSSITSNSATCGGVVTSAGGTSVTARGVCWSTSQLPTVSNSHTSDGSGTGSFTSNITGLSANTTYYVRAYATNNSGTAYGEQKTFTTSNAVLPTVTTNTISEVGTSYAFCGGNVTSDGGSTVMFRGVCWSTSQNPTLDNFYTNNGYGTGSFTSTISGAGVNPNTTYYVRAYATNSVGTAYGEQRSFTTYSGGGTTTPSAPTNVTATLSGTHIHISWNSVSSATSYKVYRSSSSSGSYTQIGTPTSNYYDDPNPLSGYNYYKIKAVNSSGESSYSPVASCNNSGGGGTTAPNAPTGVTVTNMGSSSSPQIKISWNSVSNATNYKVYRCSTASGTYSQIGSATSNTYLYDNSPLSGYNYYKVKAVNSAGESGYSSYDYYNNTGGGGGSNTPCSPTVSVGSGTYSQTISWTVNTGSGCGTPTSFQVWQFIPCTNQWLQLGTTSSHSYVSTSVYPGVNQYKVVAVNSAGTAEGTANSSSVPLSAPSGALWTDDLGNGCVQFSWSAVDMATGYEIWYSTNGVNYYLDQTINDGGATTTTKCYTQFSGDIVSFKIRAFFNCYGLGPTIDPIYSSFVTGGTIWF